MHKRIYSAALIMVGVYCLLGVPARAIAQGNTWPGANIAQMVEAARWRLGILRLNAALQLINTGYDTDVYYGYLEEPVPDWTLSASLPVQLILPLGKKAVLDVTDTPQYLFYLDTEKERAWNNTFRGSVHFALDRVYAQAGGGTADVRRRFSPELDINVRERRDHLDGFLLWQSSRTTSLALIYGSAKYDYRDDEYLGSTISEQLNRDEQYFDLVTYLQPSSRTRLSLGGQYGIYNFEDETSISRNARSYGIYAGAEFIPRVGEIVGSAGIRGNIRVGYQYLDLVDAGQLDGSALVGEANVTVDLTRRTSARVLIMKDFNFSIYSGAAFYASTRFGAGLSQRLSRRATLSYDLSFGRTDYPELEGGAQPMYRTTTHMLGLHLILARHLELTFLGTYYMRTDISAELSSKRGFLGINLTYGSLGRRISMPVGGLAP